MKTKLILLMFIVMCILSCNKSNTAGVKVDANGNLVINAPLYLLLNEKDGKLKNAEKSFADNIEVFIGNYGDRHKISEGKISGRRVSITVPIPDSEVLQTVDKLFNTDLVESGNDVRIGFINFSGVYSSVFLVDNPRMDLYFSPESFYSPTVGDDYFFVYSEGDVVISGSDSMLSYNADNGFYSSKIIYNYTLTKGWNTLCYSRTVVENETLSDITDNKVSKEIPSSAVWLLYKNDDDLVDRGREYLNDDEYDMAIECFNETIKIDPNNADAYYFRGAAFLKKEDWDEAIANFTEVIQLASDYARAYNLRGSAYVEKENYDQALMDFNMAIQLDPNFVNAYNNRAYAHYNLSNEKKAIEDLETALKIDPDNDYAKETLETIRWGF